MSEPLFQEWRRCARRATAWEAGQDPDPVLEALALTVAVELTGDLAQAPGAERDLLRRTGQRALLHVGGTNLDEDDLEALRMCTAIARDGLRALAGRMAPRPADLDTRVLIPASDLQRLLRGELDGYAAGALALKIRRSDAARAELRVLETLMQPEEATRFTRRRTLSLAAAEEVTVLDPSAGRVVGTLPEAGAEAVLFEGSPPRLAVYAEDPFPLRLVGPGLHTEGVREGYWIGRIEHGRRDASGEPGAASQGVINAERAEAAVGAEPEAGTPAIRDLPDGPLQTTLQIGERSFPWVLDLS